MDPEALNGFVLSQSAMDALLLMGRHREATQHGAFTWTGPYGSGKSSLAVAFSTLLSGTPSVTSKLLAHATEADAAELRKFFRQGKSRWLPVPVVGSRSNPEDAISKAMSACFKDAGLPKRLSNETLATWISRATKTSESKSIVLFIDEMGKFLEHAALDDGDIHIFQELAEAAARSEGRLIVIGILHQAFDEYAHRISREGRDEWLKIQGRFLDVPVSLAGEEHIELISRAIQSSAKQKPKGQAARVQTQSVD